MPNFLLQHSDLIAQTAALGRKRKKNGFTKFETKIYEELTGYCRYRSDAKKLTFQYATYKKYYDQVFNEKILNSSYTVSQVSKASKSWAIDQASKELKRSRSQIYKIVKFFESL